MISTRDFLFTNPHERHKLTMTIHVKNMVCLRCKMAVQAVLDNFGIKFSSIELGTVKLLHHITPTQLIELDIALKHYGLEVMADKRQVLVEKVKILIVDMFHSSGNNVRVKFSEYLSKSLYYDYTYLANIFSEIEGSTIERFYIESRIERAKEMIIYDGLSITEIAYLLNFSSVSHLCLQFKKISGVTPATFRKLCESEDYIWKACD